jgi:hypothetical protein
MDTQTKTDDMHLWNRNPKEQTSDDIHIWIRKLTWDAFNAVDDLYIALQALSLEGQFTDTLEDRLEDVEEMREWLGERTQVRSIELSIPDLSLAGC